MNTETVAVFIPIIFFLVVGLVFVVYFYLRSRERQMLIEKGLTAEEMKNYFERKKDPYVLLKIGIISVFFGLGLGIGMIYQDATDKGYYIPLFMFTLVGIGFIVANLASRKLDKRED